jgi:hypothetical protein
MQTVHVENVPNTIARLGSHIEYGDFVKKALALKIKQIKKLLYNKESDSY